MFSLSCNNIKIFFWYIFYSIITVVWVSDGSFRVISLISSTPETNIFIIFFSFFFILLIFYINPLLSASTLISSSSEFGLKMFFVFYSTSVLSYAATNFMKFSFSLAAPDSYIYYATVGAFYPQCWNKDVQSQHIHFERYFCIVELFSHWW